jgi:carboxyl-terminal processing protease
MSKKLQVFLLSSSFAILAFALVSGFGVHASSNNNADKAYTHIQVYSEVLYHIRAEYVEEPNMPSVTNGALHGLLESLDADSSYLSPAEYKAFKQTKASGKAGIGATVSKRFGYAAIVSVISGGPADKAGLSSGDILEAVDGLSTHDLSLAALKTRLSGEPGSRVECSVIRARKIEPQKITIVRENESLPGVEEQQMADNVGYIKAQVLTKGKAQEIANKIKSLQKQGAKKLVLDLRNNSQGDEEEGVAVANLFLGKGLITYLQGQKYEKVIYNADPQKKITDLPVAVLVNHGTAGAAEVITAAILDNQRGDVVGDKTFGEGSVQKLIEVPDGSALILSVAKYYTPNGKVIQENGITPNVQVASAVDLAVVPDDEDGNSVPDEPQKTQPKDDDQLHRAIEVLKAKTPKT